MELQTSHLAAALMSGSSTFANTSISIETPASKSIEENKVEKPIERSKESSEGDKEDIGSGEEFSDEVLESVCLCIGDYRLKEEIITGLF